MHNKIIMRVLGIRNTRVFTVYIIQLREINIDQKLIYSMFSVVLFFPDCAKNVFQIIHYENYFFP